MSEKTKDLIVPASKKLRYDNQQKGIDKIFEVLEKSPDNYNLLYQLPTGGGKTVIFSEIARRYIETSKKKVLILTHRIELCAHTSTMLDGFDVKNKIINSKKLFTIKHPSSSTNNLFKFYNLIDWSH